MLIRFLFRRTSLLVCNCTWTCLMPPYAAANMQECLTKALTVQLPTSLDVILSASAAFIIQSRSKKPSRDMGSEFQGMDLETCTQQIGYQSGYKSPTSSAAPEITWIAQHEAWALFLMYPLTPRHRWYDATRVEYYIKLHQHGVRLRCYCLANTPQDHINSTLLHLPPVKKATGSPYKCLKHDCQWLKYTY